MHDRAWRCHHSHIHLLSIMPPRLLSHVISDTGPAAVTSSLQQVHVLCIMAWQMQHAIDVEDCLCTQIQASVP